MDWRYWLLLLFFLQASCLCVNAQNRDNATEGSGNIRNRNNATEGLSPLLNEAKKYVGTREIGNNQGFTNRYLEQGLKKVGWHKSEPYCAYFVSFILNEVNAKFPKTRSGAARAFINSKSILAKDVAKGYKKAQPGWLVIWRRGSEYKGHIGFVLNWQMNKGRTIEANTSADKGLQYDGDGIWERSREIIGWGNFRIDYFTPVL